MQEALTNVVRHAGTGRCRVTIAYGDQELSVEVVDDGRVSPDVVVMDIRMPGMDGIGATRRIMAGQATPRPCADHIR